MAELTYSVICASIVGSMSEGFGTFYSLDEDRFPTRKEAISHGFTFDRSDDFNIGVWSGSKLVSIDWMEKVVDADPALLRTIQRDGYVPA